MVTGFVDCATINHHPSNVVIAREQQKRSIYVVLSYIMGVKGLWKLFLPIGQRNLIETLESKVVNTTNDDDPNPLLASVPSAGTLETLCSCLLAQMDFPIAPQSAGN